MTSPRRSRGSPARRTVVVIGAGIAGASAAWELAADHDVVLLEQEPQPGHHATGRSAAILSETSGPRAVCALARASRPFLEAPPAGFADHPLTSPRGLLWVGRAGDEPLLDAIESVARSGVAPTARRVRADQAVALHPALTRDAVAAGALHEPDARSIDVAALLQAYVRGASRRGALVLTGAPATGATAIDHRRGGWHVVVGDTAIEADVVVDAGGAWGDAIAELADVAPLGLTPMRRTACVVPLTDVDRSWPLVMDVAGRYYFEPEAGGLLVSPADESPSAPLDARPDEEDVARALDALREATTLPVRSVVRAWAGLRTFAADRVPVVGEDPDAPGFVWLVGQGGAGVKTAPAMAEALGSVVRGEPWPEALRELGVTADDLAPARLR